MSGIKPLLRGIVPPLLTPLTPGDGLDAASLDKLIDHAIGGGVHGLFVLGTTGELAAMSGNVRREVIRQTCRTVRRRVPVTVGVTDTVVSESIALARVAADAGADAIVVNTPYYLPLTQAEVVRHVRILLDAQPLPILLYNFPALTKTAFEPRTVRELADQPRVIGIKDSSGDLDYLRAVGGLVAGRPDFSLLVGGEGLMVAAIQNGAHGCVGGGANLDPALLAGLYDAVVAGDHHRTETLHARLRHLGRIYTVADGVAGVIKATKYAASRLGLCDAKMAEPFLPLSDGQREQIDRVLADLRLTKSEPALSTRS